MCPIFWFFINTKLYLKAKILVRSPNFTCDLSEPPAPNQGVGADMGQQTQTDIQFKLYTGRGHNIFTILNILKQYFSKQFVTILLYLQITKKDL